MTSTNMLLPLLAVPGAVLRRNQRRQQFIAKVDRGPGQTTQHPTVEGNPGPCDANGPSLRLSTSILKKFARNWDASVSTTMPGRPVNNWTAKASYRAVGETWVVSISTGVMNGMPYIGHGLDGYDTNKKKFVSTWVDSMGTELMLMEGTHDASKNSTSVSGETHDR